MVARQLGHVRCGECVLFIKLGCHRQLCHVRVPLGRVSLGGLVMCATPIFLRILHTSGPNARKINPRRPLELSGGPTGAVSQRRSRRLDEKVCYLTFGAQTDV